MIVIAGIYYYLVKRDRIFSCAIEIVRTVDGNNSAFLKVIKPTKYQVVHIFLDNKSLLV